MATGISALKPKPLRTVMSPKFSRGCTTTPSVCPCQETGPTPKPTPTAIPINHKELLTSLNWYDYGARWYDAAVGRFPCIDPLAERFAWVSPYNYAENEPVGHVDLWGLQKSELTHDFLRWAKDYVVSKITQAAYDMAISLIEATIYYVDRNYNPVTVYDNITNPHSELPEWQAESLAKHSNEAVDAEVFIESISGLSKNEAKRQEEGHGSFGSQSGGPELRYVFDPANSDRVIDMRHFLSVGDMGEAIGFAIEVVQSTSESWRPSAFDLQDFYSNELGAQFYNSEFYEEYKSGEVDFSQALSNFFEYRAKQ